VDPGLTLNVTVRRPDDLQALEARGVPVARLTAFTGTAEPRPGLWRELDRRGVPVGFGTLGRRDDAIAMSGSDRHYAGLARQGVDVIATSRPQAAFAAVDEGGRTARALAACKALRR
jgi:glycerophosphoryl diester phosphodiesterase